MRLPGWQAAVEHVDLSGAEDAEGPPHARRRIKAGGVIDDDGVGVGDAERAHRRAELIRPGQHVRQIGGGVGDGVEVEEHRARNMRGDIFRLRIAFLDGQIIGGVDHDDFADIVGEPLRGFEPAAGGGGFAHMRLAFVKGQGVTIPTPDGRGGSVCPSFRFASPARRRFRRSRAHGCRRRAANRDWRSRSAAPGRCPLAASPTWS